jgi:membrane protease subunit HflC
MWRRNVATIIAGGFLAILLVAYMSTYQVRFNEVAIVKTLGQIRHVQTEPGLRVCWPWPIQQVVKYDLRVNVLEDPLSEPLTQGGKPVTAQAYMAWRIKKPELFLTKVGSVSQATSQLKTKLKSQKEAILGGYSLANFVSTDKADLKLPEVERILRDNMDAWAEEMFGIEVLSVGIKRLGVPASTSREIFEAMKEGRGELIQQYRSEGQAEADRIRSEADKISKQIQSFANLRAEQLRAEGQAKAAEQFKEFQKNEAFAIFLKEINMLRQTLQANTTIVLDWTARPFNFFTEGPSLPPAPPVGAMAASAATRPAAALAATSQPANEAQ